jgi:DNA primase
MVVNTKLNRWKCFGCHEGGDVIDLAMKVEKISFAEAVKKLT